MTSVSVLWSYLGMVAIYVLAWWFNIRWASSLLKQRGQLINADVNGAYNIIQKAVPKAFAADGIEALGLVPQSILIV